MEERDINIRLKKTKKHYKISKNYCDLKTVKK